MTKSRGRRFSALCCACIAALIASSSPVPTAARAARFEPITGSLSKSGYTVIALTPTGRATTVRVRHHGFKLRPRGEVVTLHLRAKDGTYAGPIVVAHSSTRAVVGVSAGARLGLVEIDTRKGYAELARALPKRWRVGELWARAKRGVPKGAGNFGFVRSCYTHGGVPGDLDLDGVPKVLDVDSDGDKVLNGIDQAPRRCNRSRRSGLSASIAPRVPQQEDGPVTASTFSTGSFFVTSVTDMANADMPGATDSQLDATFTERSSLNVSIVPGDSAELDCGGTPNPSPPPPLLGGLVYCSSGGTGQAAQPGGPQNGASFPDCCDGDGDGYGTLFSTESTTPCVGDCPPSEWQIFSLSAGATSAQIGTGDVLIQRVTTAGVESQYAAVVPFVFATVPTLVSYSDTAGNGATVPYPVAETDSGIPGSGGPGTNGNGFEIEPGPNGDIVVTMTLWRPQRRPIPPETGSWIEMGGLNYLLGAHDYSTPGQQADVPRFCPQDAYSSDDPNLGPAPEGSSNGLIDLTLDRPADPANTFTFTVNITKCLAHVGLSWDTGEEWTIEFQAEASGQANGGYSNASQNVQFVLGPVPSPSPSPSETPTPSESPSPSETPTPSVSPT